MSPEFDFDDFPSSNNYVYNITPERLIKVINTLWNESVTEGNSPESTVNMIIEEIGNSIFNKPDNKFLAYMTLIKLYIEKRTAAPPLNSNILKDLLDGISESKKQVESIWFSNQPDDVKNIISYISLDVV